MIYEIKNKYYVKIGSLYNEIKIELDDFGEVVLTPLKNRIEVKDEKIIPINFQTSKEMLKRKLKSKNDFNNRSEHSKYNKNKK